MNIRKYSLNRQSTIVKSNKNKGFPGGSVVKNPPANAGDTSIPGLGRSNMLWSN